MTYKFILIVSVCLALFGLTACETATVVSLQKWEYKCWESNRDDAQDTGFINHLESKFNTLGTAGWEMVGYGMNNGVNVRYVCFKRPKNPGAK